jgi:hypothetical protein
LVKNGPYLASLGAQPTREFALERGEVSIGSDPGNDLVVAETTVSRRHAKLIRGAGAYRLLDLNSTNGTFVNGRRIDSPTAVKNGDELRFGAARFTLSDPNIPAPPGQSGRRPTDRWRPGPFAIAGIVAAFIVAGFAIGEYLLDWDQIEQAADVAADSAQPQALHAGASSAASRPAGAARPPSPAAASTPAMRHASPAEIAAAKVWLEPLNHYRVMAGLRTVEPDPALSAADASHARYLVENFADRIKAETLGIEAHTEDPAKADYSPAGAKAAAASDVEEGYSHRDEWLTPSAAIAGWISVPLHRLWLLNPNLLRAGYGQYCHAGVCVGALDVGTDINPVREAIAPYPQAIRFPPDGAAVPMRSADGEWPDPLTACAGYSYPTGLPITLQLGSNVDPKLTAYSLKSGGGAAVEVCGFDAASYTNPDPLQQRRARTVLGIFGTVIVIPRAPLASGAYTVSITADGREYKWSFTIGPSF